MYTLHPNQGEVYYLRLLLLHVGGPTSFTELRTVNGELCETFKDACARLNLLNNDDEWRDCLTEASTCQMASRLRQLFVTLLVFCEPANPLSLFEQFADNLAEDIAHQLKKKSNNGSNEASHNKLLIMLQKLLPVHGRSLSDFKLPIPEADLQSIDDEFEDQRDADAADFHSLNEPLLNTDQRII